jgi:hypothetical protein
LTLPLGYAIVDTFCDQGTACTGSPLYGANARIENLNLDCYARYTYGWKVKPISMTCCEVWAKGNCSLSKGGFNVYVNKFDSEAQCYNFVNNSPSTSYTCNCDEFCPGRNDHNPNQICDWGEWSNITEGKSICSTSGSQNFQVKLINPEACVIPTVTP